MSLIRTGEEADLAQIAAIQSSSPQASQWYPHEYLSYYLFVAESENRVTGFAVFRRLAPGEFELLNLAVDPADRRRGIARQLFETALAKFQNLDANTPLMPRSPAAIHGAQNSATSREAGEKQPAPATTKHSSADPNFNSKLSIFLEVRESNYVAQKFYKSLGFQPVSLRQNYYSDPPESAVVMKFHSC